MKTNRKRVVTGFVAAGLVAGTLAGGGVALASTGGTPAPATSASAQPSTGWCGGQFGGMGGMWSGQHSVMAAAASYLGLSQAELRAQLQAGRSLADVAKAQGKPVSGLKDAILAAMTSRVNASGLTAAQKAAMLSHMRSHLDAMINSDMDMADAPGMGMGHMGSSGGMGMWR